MLLLFSFLCDLMLMTDTPPNKIQVVKILFKFEEELDTLKKNDETSRKHGRNPVIARLIALSNELRIKIVGCCEYEKQGMCTLLEISCDLANKEECAVRQKQIEFETQQKKSELKNNIFIKIEGFKKVKKDELKENNTVIVNPVINQ